MLEETTEITEGIRRAIQAEVEGQHFYLMAARATSDVKGREVFELLAQDEVAHVNFLRAHHDALSTNGELDPNATLGAFVERTEPSPIFSDALKQRIGEAHFEMTALSIGIQLEQSAVKYYQAQADKTDHPRIKQFYLDLAEWERGHHQLLLSQQDYLKEDYWSASGFSPF